MQTFFCSWTSVVEEYANTSLYPVMKQKNNFSMWEVGFSSLHRERGSQCPNHNNVKILNIGTCMSEQTV